MEFKNYTLDDVIICYDKKRKPISTMQRKERKGKYPYYGAQEIIDYIDDYIFDGKFILLAEDGENLRSQKKDLVKITKGKFWLNNHAHVFQNKEGFNLEYIYYYLLNYDFRPYITGTTQPKLNQENMLKIEIKAPKINEQIKISKILIQIDKKIEINNQINYNLSELALTLFKEFIEQNKDSSEKIHLKDCVEKIGTGADAIQRAPIVDYDTGIRCIRVGDMTNNRKYYEWGFTEMTDKDFENYRLDLGDIVVTRTAVNGITKIIDDNERIVCNNGLIRLKVNNKYNPMYIYMCTKTKDFYDYIHRIDSETSVRPNMKVDYFTSYQIDKISLEKQNEFCNKIDPMLKLQKELEQEIYNLGQLRDTLLPKLMNGEIDLYKIEI